MDTQGGSTIADRIAPIAERVARRSGCELAWLQYRREQNGWVLRVVIDREEGVSVEHCASVSRQLSTLLDVEDFIPHAYTLEVSSPGLDRPLRGERDFLRFAGRAVRIKTTEPIDGSRLLRGRLRGLEHESVQLDDDSGNRVEVPLERIAEARLEVEIGMAPESGK